MFRSAKLMVYGSLLASMFFTGFAHAQQRDVEIRLESLRVHDDCDNVSDGDWFISLSARQSGTPDELAFNIFPNVESPTKVETDTTVAIGRSVTLRRVPVSNTIEAFTNALDCDTDGPSLAGSFLVPLYFPIAHVTEDFASGAVLPGPEVNCDDQEEDLEDSGNHDRVGSATLRLASSQWNQGGRFTVRPLGSEQCLDGGIDLSFGGTISEPGGFQAYTAVIQVNPGILIVDGSLIMPAMTMPYDE